MINNDIYSAICCLGQLRSVASRESMSYKSHLNVFCKVSYSFHTWCFQWCSITKEQNPLFGTDTHSHIVTQQTDTKGQIDADTGTDSLDSLQAGTDLHSYNR